MSERNLPLSVVGRGGLAAGSGTATVVIGRDLGLNAAAVGCVSNRWEDGADSLNQAVLLAWSGVLESRLDDIVGKRIPKHSLHLLAVQHLLDNQILGRRQSAAQALLNDVGAELVSRQLTDTPTEHLHHGLGEGGIVEINDVLDNVVAKRVLDQNSGIIGDAFNQPELLVARGMIDTTLKNAAAMAVGSNFDAVVSDGIENELGIFRAQLVQTLLNDMVAIEILDKLDDTEAKGLDDEMDLLRSVHKLNHLLQSSCTVLVQSNADHVVGCILDEDGSFVVIAELEELLAQIITKWVRHELGDVLVGFSPNQVHLLRVTIVELLLKVTATMLILAEIIDLANIGFERHVLVSGHSCSFRQLMV